MEAVRVGVAVEADTVVGPFLAGPPEWNGVARSVAYGDQPAPGVELADRAKTAGFEIFERPGFESGQDEVLTHDDVDLDTGSFRYRLRETTDAGTDRAR